MECGDEQCMTSSTLYKSGVILENMSMCAAQRKNHASNHILRIRSISHNMDIIYLFLYLIFRHLDTSTDAIKIVTLFMAYTPMKYPGVSWGAPVLCNVSTCLYK